MKKTNMAFPKVLIVLIAAGFVFSAGTGINQLYAVEQIKGASVESVQKESVIKGAGPYSNISIGTISALPEIQEKYKSQVSELKNSLIQDLRSNKKFTKVLVGNKASGKTVIVSGKIIKMNIVDLQTRQLHGGFAGKSYIDIQLKLTDASNGKVIKEIVIGTYNNPAGAGWSRGATDQSMPADMGKIISAYLSTVIPVK
ncbi:MAG TPA: DUF4410 domain-containing protein [Spirochaetota bacterium]|nr:DUF4410 domain-containing protein [Spirochaetota bacterium]HPI89708.1 DUF4410 domain-containing protein [Spirochaetota bacterium]HPR48333.1 DUF4410 domain-containing protein [Spirochaetota bacterium]